MEDSMTPWRFRPVTRDALVSFRDLRAEDPTLIIVPGGKRMRLRMR
jgi:hypothetical protein